MAVSQEKFIALWQKRIAKGRTHFMLKFTVLWGGAMLLLVPLFNLIFEGTLTLNAFIAEFTTTDIFLKLIVFPLAGTILGYINWNNGIKRYYQITEPQETEGND